MKFDLKYLAAFFVLLLINRDDARGRRMSRRERKEERRKLLCEYRTINNYITRNVNYKFFQVTERNSKLEPKLCIPKFATNRHTSIYRSWPLIKRHRRKMCRQKNKILCLLQVLRSKCEALAPQIRDITDSNTGCEYVEYVPFINRTCHDQQMEQIQSLLLIPHFTSICSDKIFTLNEEESEIESVLKACTCEDLPISNFIINEPFEKIEEQINKLRKLTTVCEW